MTFLSDWPPSAAATFAASALAAAVALLSILTTVIDGAVSRRRAATAAVRDQWWTRWSFTIEKAMKDRRPDREIGTLPLQLLVDIPVSPAEDVRTAIALARAVAAQDDAAGRGR